VATAIGLVAAIPAVIAYNHFLNKVNVLIRRMDNFCQEMLNVVQRMAAQPPGTVAMEVGQRETRRRSMLAQIKRHPFVRCSCWCC